MAEVAEPLKEAILEMEINSLETARAVLDYVRAQQERNIDRIQDSERDFGRFAKEFERLAETEKERELGRQVAVLYSEFKALGDEITSIAKRRNDDLQIFRKAVLAIDELIAEKLQPAIDRTAADALTKLEAALDMEININEAFSAIRGYILKPSPDLRQQIADSEANFERFEAQYRGTRLSADEEKWLDQIDKDFAEAVTAGNEIVALTDELNEKLGKFEADLEEIDRILDDEVQVLIHAETVRAVEDAKRSGELAITLLLVVGLFIFAVVAGMGRLVSKGIIDATDRLTEGAAEFGQGNLDHRIKTRTEDELGVLAAAFNEMANKLQQVEEALRQHKENLLESNERLQSALVASKTGTWRIDLRTGADTRDASLNQLLGLPAKPSTQPVEDWFTYVHPDDVDAVKLEWQRGFESGLYSVEHRLVRRDGQVLWVFDRGEIIRDDEGQLHYAIGAVMDITERKEAEIARHTSDEQVRLLLDSTAEAIYGLDLDGNCTFCNSSCLQLLGYEDSSQLLGQNMHNLIHHTRPDGTPYPMEQCRICGAFRQGHGTHVDDEVLWRADGTSFPAEYWSYPIDRDGALVGSVVTFLDITERKRAETDVLESENRFRTIFESVPECVKLLDENGNLLDMNAAGLAMIEANSIDQIYGKTIHSLIAPEYLNVFIANEQAIQRGESNTQEFEIIGLHGTRRWMESLQVPIHNLAGKKTILLAVSRDITERKQMEEEKALLEEQYRQAQKVESIGRLAGGLAHDLNNLLTPILGFGEMLLDDLAPEDARRESVDQILQAGFRARDLVHQLLAFSRKQTLEYKPLDINKAIEKFETLLRRTLREDIEIEFFLSSEMQTVMADIGQIEQVIMNLAVNAEDAMTEGGRLTIETALVDLDEDYAGRHHDVEPGAYVMLAVSDTGCGFDSETQEHLFEPFFSTKGELGTGLGLATVYGIIKQHGGHIGIDSELKKGTTFKIYLPVCEKELVESETDKKATTDLTGSETVLLVEDNEQVRKIAHIILKRQDYNVLVAENGKEALAILDHLDEPLHLLFTDVVMPEMNGKQLFARATESHPDLKVLYMSGYPDTVIAHRGVLDEGTAFIQKPFDIQDLIAKVREVLDGK